MSQMPTDVRLGAGKEENWDRDEDVDDGGEIVETHGLGVADCLTTTTEVRGIAEQLQTSVSRLS